MLEYECAVSCFPVHLAKEGIIVTLSFKSDRKDDRKSLGVGILSPFTAQSRHVFWPLNQLSSGVALLLYIPQSVDILWLSAAQGAKLAIYSGLWSIGSGHD